MTSQIFELQIKEGKLTIPLEIQNYLLNCSEDIKVSLIVEFKSVVEDSFNNDWNQWFQEVENITSIPQNNNEINDYKTLLINKYKQQGLEL